MAETATLIKQLSQEFKKTTDALTDRIESGVAESNKEVKELKKRYEKQFQDLQGEFGQLGEELKLAQKRGDEQEKRADELEAKMVRPGLLAPVGPVSPGAAFVASSEYKEYAKNGALKGRPLSQVEVGKVWDHRKGGFLPAEAKTLTGVTEVAHVLSTLQRTEIFGPPRLRSEHMRDHMNVVQTTERNYDFVVESGYTNAAEFRAEGANAVLSAISFDDKSESAKIVSHGIVVTKELMADAPAVQNRIDGRLRNGIWHKEDVALIKADGASNNITGITQVVGIQTFTRGQVGDTKLDNLRRSITQLHLIEIMVNGNLFILNHEDWEEIELEKDQDDNYIWVVVMFGGQKQLWRVPIFCTTAIDAGKFLLGDFMNGCTLWDRESAYVEVFNQHADFALAGKLLLMGSERIGFTVEIPEMFIDGTFGAVGSGS